MIQRSHLSRNNYHHIFSVARRFIKISQTQGFMHIQRIILCHISAVITRYTFKLTSYQPTAAAAAAAAAKIYEKRFLLAQIAAHLPEAIQTTFS